MTDLTKIDVPFGELDRETQERLLIAYHLDGRAVQYTIPGVNSFFDACSPGWIPGTIYRLEPATKPSINWDHVAPEYRFLTKNRDGRSWLHEKRPRVVSLSEGSDGDYWGGSNYTIATSFASFRPGDCDWRDSLVERPE